MQRHHNSKNNNKKYSKPLLNKHGDLVEITKGAYTCHTVDWDHGTKAS